MNVSKSFSTIIYGSISLQRALPNVGLKLFCRYQNSSVEHVVGLHKSRRNVKHTGNVESRCCSEQLWAADEVRVPLCVCVEWSGNLPRPYLSVGDNAWPRAHYVYALTDIGKHTPPLSAHIAVTTSRRPCRRSRWYLLASLQTPLHSVRLHLDLADCSRVHITLRSSLSPSVFEFSRTLAAKLTHYDLRSS